MSNFDTNTFLKALDSDINKFKKKKIKSVYAQEAYISAGVKEYGKIRNKCSKMVDSKEIETYLNKLFKQKAKALNECGNSPTLNAEWQAVYNTQVVLYNLLDEE